MGHALWGRYVWKSGAIAIFFQKEAVLASIGFDHAVVSLPPKTVHGEEAAV